MKITKIDIKRIAFIYFLDYDDIALYVAFKIYNVKAIELFKTPGERKFWFGFSFFLENVKYIEKIYL